MKSELEKYELIERYLKNDLSEDELRQVKEKIHSDSQFAREVKQHEAIMNFVVEGSLLEIKNSIQDIHINNRPSFIRRIFNPRFSLYIMGGIILIGALFLYFSLKSKRLEVTEKPVYTEYSRETSGQSSQSDTQVKTDLQKVSLDNSKPVSSVPDKNQIISKTPADKEKQVNSSEIPSKQEVLAVYKSDMINTEPVLDDKNKETVSEKEKDPVVYDCNQTKISAEITTEPSCIRESTGVINIDQNKIEGGTPPYAISINNKRSFQDQYSYSQLRPGSYIIWIADKNNCMEKLGSYWINTKDCSEEAIEFIFAPEKLEQWKIPQIENSFEIDIYNQQGVIIYRTDIDENSEYYWDGNSNSGVPQPMGIYSYRIKRRDQIDITGNVTIVR